MLCVFTLFKSLKSMYHCKEEGMSVKERIRNDIFQLASKHGFVKPAQQSYSEDILNRSLYRYLENGKINLANIPLYLISKVPNSEDVAFNLSAKSLGDIVLDSTKIQHEHKIKIADKNIKWDAPFIEEGFYTGYEYGDFNDLRVDFAYEDEDQNTITMIESKLGAVQTWGKKIPSHDYHKSAQFARYADWMIASQQNLSKRNRNLVVLSAGDFFQKQWYVRELFDTLEYNQRKEKILVYLIIWEDIFPMI